MASTELEVRVEQGHGNGHSTGHSHGHGPCHGHSHDHDSYENSPLLDIGKPVYYATSSPRGRASPHGRVVEDGYQLKISKHTDNLLILFELQELKHASVVNLVLCILSLLYVAINIVGLDWNGHSGEYRARTHLFMHYLEFWSTLVFALVEVCALVYSPKSLTSIARSNSTTLLKFVVFLNVVSGATAALLYTLDPVNNERASHEIEYVNEVCVAFVDFLFLRGLLPNLRSSASATAEDEYASVWDQISGIFVTVCFMLAIAQIWVYNSTYQEWGEQDAHWMEFSFGIVAGFVSFWFCMDNKFMADNRVEAIICGCNSGHHLTF